MNTFAITITHLVVTTADREAGIAVTSWAVPSGATPRHGERRHANRKRATPNTRWAAGRRASRRTPGPSLAGHRSYRNRLTAGWRSGPEFGAPRGSVDHG